MVDEAKKIFLGFSPNEASEFYDPPKNYSFYFSKSRCTKISRRFYPEYTKGYLFGYYIQKPDSIEKKNDDGSLEREF